ncbi:electroneutral sodium bicarbonate exchanger 1-like isoform X2 [Physella acuta]|uniref:electroneutral sodium bicarbonate exchanger 1-like isoform X2 n=1 Tax=Physella acuta TaxID=109671 RepID=UPI0027DE87A7|nr:electroneutral sodium bicarbonate exchanger 1-like isoform X2 [Physella acuta]
MEKSHSLTLPEATPVQRDLGARREINENVIDSDAFQHRYDSAYIGLRLPKRPRRPHKSKRHHGDKTAVPNSQPVSDAFSPGPGLPGFYNNSSLTPSEQIQSLLSEAEDPAHTSHDVFCEMDVLFKMGEIYQWRETARWVKYEEDVEEGGMRWSKPHVASLSLHSLFELRSSLTTGACMLEMDATSIQQVADLLIDNLISQKQLEESLRDQVRLAIMAQHCFQHQKPRRKVSTTPDLDGGQAMFRKLSMKRTFSEIGRTFSMKSKNDALNQARLRANPNSQPNLEMMNGDLSESPSSTRISQISRQNSLLSKLNEHFMRKIPAGAEAANILVGELECLNYQVVAFIRLCEGRNIGDITEVPIPTRFMFILFGPPGSQQKNVEIGRSMSTIMVDEVFREVAYKARNRQDILAGVDEFLDQVTALPPGEWDPKIRIEPPQSVPSQAQRKVPKPPVGQIAEEEEEEEESHCDPTLQRSGRLFGGLVADIKRKLPWYASDFKDSLHIQCVASVIFLYLATLTPNVTFGGLLGQATDQYMGTMECILTASIVGVLFALFSGQPLNILGSTGPMLVLEMILYHFCKEQELDFLPFRAWIGLWTAFLLMLIVAFDLSALVRYITRFTEESFASLIAVIFIVEAFTKLIEVLKDAPVNFDPDAILNYTCTCLAPNSSEIEVNISMIDFTNSSSIKDTILHYLILDDTQNITLGNDTFDFSNLSIANINWSAVPVSNCSHFGGVPITVGCKTPHFIPDAFFLSVLLFLGTFMIASSLTNAKTSAFFPTFVRQTLSDFAVLIAIIAMVTTDILIGIPTPKLLVPTKFQPTRDDRGWFINPISDKNPFWLIFAAILPALLAVILIFMDQQITAVIVNRKENKLKKGSGYHLDMFVVAICIAICSLLGLPWYVAATVSALAHVMSLKKESECTAPGERPTFLGVREQRVTALLVGLLSGTSVLFTHVLQFIPMAVLYGVFLYMGVAALKGMQFIDRLLLFFKPAKYQPDYIYLRHVPIKRVHIFTVIQIICLAVLWVIKSVKSVSIIFPIMVLGTCFVRKAMDYIFTQRELKWLDDLMPEATRKEKEDERKKKLQELQTVPDDEDDALIHEENYDKLMEIRIDRLGDNRLTNRHSGVRRGSLDTDRVNISEEVARTGIWMQIRRDSKSALADVEDFQNSRHKKKRHEKSNGRDYKSSNKDKESEETTPLHDEKNDSPPTNRNGGAPPTFYMGEEEEDHKV